ncbi:MAG: alpha/beta fold hydrolase [Planctomycetaceae bacterium]|nr:alpha/beta fold hydrolase [Planctomycetaceae bacterium]
MSSFSLPAFRPHPLVRGGHAQTLAAYFWPGTAEYSATHHQVPLEDGDTIVLHDDSPPGWQPGHRVALLMPGLAGCHGSGYLVRTAAKLNARGVRTFRMDQRGWGAGSGLAEHPFHAGRSGDVLAALEFLSELCPDSPLAVIGFSLSGNVTLKFLGEFPNRVPRLERAAALTPPINLSACADWMERSTNRFYNRFLTGCLIQHLKENNRPLPEKNGQSDDSPKTLREFDDRYTAPAAGFDSADQYYSECSSGPLLSKINIPTLIVVAEDDPMIPISSFADVPLSSDVHLHVSKSGGHLGFISRGGLDPDRRWLDWRIVDWITAEPLPTVC